MAVAEAFANESNERSMFVYESMKRLWFCNENAKYLKRNLGNADASRMWARRSFGMRLQTKLAATSFVCLRFISLGRRRRMTSVSMD